MARIGYRLLNEFTAILHRDKQKIIIRYLDSGRGIEVSRGINSSRKVRVALNQKRKQLEASLIEHEKIKHYLFNNTDLKELWEKVKSWII